MPSFGEMPKCLTSSRTITLLVLCAYMLILSPALVTEMNETFAEHNEHMKRMFLNVGNDINLRIELAVLVVSTCLVGLYGVCQKRRKCLLPFLIFQGLLVVLLIVLSLHSSSFEKEANAYGICAFFMFALWFPAFSHYREIEKEKNTVSAV